LTQGKFKTFTPKEICDVTKSTEVLVCSSLDSREKVDEMVRNAVADRGATCSEPQDHGFMYGHGFQDLDGHIWEILTRHFSRRFPIATGEAKRQLNLPNKRSQEGDV
jgi:hypothetical protein